MVPPADFRIWFSPTQCFFAIRMANFLKNLPLGILDQECSHGRFLEKCENLLREWWKLKGNSVLTRKILKIFACGALKLKKTGKTCLESAKISKKFAPEGGEIFWDYFLYHRGKSKKKNTDGHGRVLAENSLYRLSFRRPGVSLWGPHAVHGWI